MSDVDDVLFVIINETMYYISLVHSRVCTGRVLVGLHP